MIKPASLYAFGKSCKPTDADIVIAGKVLLAVCGVEGVGLTVAEEKIVEMIVEDSKWMDERVEVRRKKDGERLKKWRETKRDETNGNEVKRGETRFNGVKRVSGDGNALKRGETECNNPSIHPSIHPSYTDINRSVTVKGVQGENGTETGTVEISDLKDLERRAVKCSAVLSSDISAVFDPTWDVPTLCRVITGDRRSARRWAQLVKAKGEDAVRGEIYAFLGELKAGEEPNNRGAALNARLGDLKDK